MAEPIAPPEQFEAYVAAGHLAAEIVALKALVRALLAKTGVSDVTIQMDDMPEATVHARLAPGFDARAQAHATRLLREAEAASE